MATKLRMELSYPAPLAEVSAMLLDRDFREQVLANQQVLRGEVTIDGGSVRIEQVQSAADVPSFARKFVGEEITILQLEDWTSPDHADIDVSIPHKPGHMRGTATLTERKDHTVELIDLEIQVHIPLVGGKIEKLIESMLEKALDAEYETGLEWLDRG